MFTHMGELNTIRTKKAEVRNKLLELGKQESPDREATNALLTELQGLETREAALLAAEGESETTTEATEATTTPETRELEKLRAESRIGDVMGAVLSNRNTTGATKELQQHAGLSADQVPIEMLLVDGDQAPETRAAATIPADVGATAAPILARVFPRSIAAFLGINMPRVATGERVYPVLANSATVGLPAKSASQAESTAAFTSETLKPKRAQASFRWTREDAATFAGLEEALRLNIRDALSDKLDFELLRSTTDGLLAGTVLTANAASGVDDYDSFLERFAYGSVDGVHVDMVSGLRMVVGTTTYAAMGTIKASSTAVSALDALRGAGVQVRVGAHVPAAASNKQNALVRVGNRGGEYVFPIWDSITFVLDELSDAAKGELVLTAYALFNQKLIRAAGFRKVEAQFAA